MNKHDEALPLVYSCSGCSNVAQLANRIAIQLDRDGLAEMSCIAGVGGNVRPLVNKAKSGRKVIAIDGCPLACSKNCLQQHNVNADHYYQLSHLNTIIQGTSFKKTYKADCTETEFRLTYYHICNDYNKQDNQGLL